MKRNLGYAVLLAIIFSSSLSAAEVMVSARQVELRKGSITLYSARETRSLNFSLSGSESVSVEGLSYQSSGRQDIEATAAASHVSVQMLFNPNDELCYWLRCGAVAYELELPSTTIKNTVWGYKPGIRIGAGARKLLFPDTLFSPALAVSAGITYERQGLDTLRNKHTVKQAVENFIEVTEYQILCSISKKYKYVEPYGSLRVARVCTALVDTVNNSEIRGYNDGVSISAGCSIQIFSKEQIVVEASFGSLVGLSAGWQITF